MCGIAGCLSYQDPVEKQHLSRMIGSLRHRGPDDEGIYLNSSAAGSIGLGSRRLSIIDLPGGRMPIHNEKKDVWIVFNGEIYNFPELRNLLKGKGHSFYTSADTEVIVHLYEEYGEKCLQYLNGMFSFALWDDAQKKLFLARDRMGEKPLYYCWKDERLLFASELKAILAYPGFERAIDPASLVHYLQCSYIPDPHSIFQDVFKLKPGHYLTLANRQLKVEKYWEPDFQPVQPESEGALVEELLARLKQSVRMRMISDVPLGVFLSGGVDSSLIVALMSQISSDPVRTFSIGFDHPDYNELPYAKIVSEQFGTKYTERMVGPGDFSVIEKIVSHFDEPFGDSSALPMYYVSELAGRDVKVVLSGDGGDELFAGYDTYASAMGRQKYEKIPRPVRTLMRWAARHLPVEAYGKNFLFNISLEGVDRFIDGISFISGFRHAALLSKDLRAGLNTAPQIFSDALNGNQNLDLLSKTQLIDQKVYLPGDILVKVDRMTMAHSIEARVPLLDHTLVEFINRIPPEYKVRGGKRKYVLKQAAAQLLSPDILERKKHGFTVPLQYWFKKELKDYIQQILLEKRTIQRGYFDPRYLKSLMQGRRDQSAILWHLLILEIWHRQYVDK